MDQIWIWPYFVNDVTMIPTIKATKLQSSHSRKEYGTTTTIIYDWVKCGATIKAKNSDK